MHPTKKAGRIAGAIYASMVFVGPFSLIYVPNKLIVRGDATATAANVLNHESMFRLWIMGDLWMSVIFICLGIALYNLLSSVSKPWALLMLSFVLVSSAVGFLDTLNNIAADLLFRGADFLSVIDKTQQGNVYQRTVLGSVALSIWPSRLSLRIYTALDRSLAHDQLFRLRDSESHRVVLSCLLRHCI
jgi:Domain of unknown function (DUF4386)